MNTNPQVEKIYVAIGDDLVDGYKTLDWTLSKWKSSSSQPISIVILHVTHGISKQIIVNSVFRKVPSSAVSDEQLPLREQEKADKLLSKYITFCAKAKVKAEILRVKKCDDKPIHKLLLELISRLTIRKLVMSTTFMKQSSRSKSGISGSFKVHQHKPDFCELFIVSGGNLVLRREENEETSMENPEKGVIIMREKTKPKSSTTKMIAEIMRNSHNSSASTNSKEIDNEWEKNVQEIERYFQYLSSLHLDEEKLIQEEKLETDTEEQDSKMDVAEKIRSLKSKLEETHQFILLKKEEGKANVKRCQKADWAIHLCNLKAEKFESQIRDEAKIRMELMKNLDIEKEQLQEISSDVDESKDRLKSLLELQTELSNKLKLSSMTTSQAQTQLEQSVIVRAQMVREIEELRRQRDVLNRRIGFCKEKDSIGLVSRFSEVSCCTEFSAEDIKLASDGFSERLRVKSGGDWTNVYRGRIYHTTIAIELMSSVNDLSPKAFRAKVELLNHIRHPHLVTMIGFCSELKCILYEYMHSVSIKDILLLSSQKNSRKLNRVLRWQDRIRVAREVCSGLAYLHSAKPTPIVHGFLTLSHILLDRNLVAKISGYGFTQCSDHWNVTTDIRAFGVLLFQLLHGTNSTRLVKEAMMMDRTELAKVLDEKAGRWPLDLAEELSVLAMKCMSSKELSIKEVLEELARTKKAVEAISGNGMAIDRSNADRDVPNIFLCPIFQEVMKNPHIAADGFSYELEAIQEWLGMGYDTSPTTNLKLKHKLLTPNLTLRSLIQDWHNRRSVP